MQSGVLLRVDNTSSVDDEVIELKVPASLAYRELVTRATAQACKRLSERGGTHDEFLNESVSAIGEAFNNVVKHAYDGSRGGEVTIVFRVSNQALEIDVLDYGIGFDPSDDPELEFPGLHESGMGLFIMRSFMDEVEHLTGNPNRLRLKKFVQSPA